MNETKIKGIIIDIDKQVAENWIKWTYTVRSEEDGKTHYLSMFISEKDFENVRLKKESILSDFKKGDFVVASYTEKGKYKTLVSMEEPIEVTNKQMDVVEIKEKPSNMPIQAQKQDRSDLTQAERILPNKASEQDLRIFRAQCFNNTCILFGISFSELSNEYFNEEIPKKVFIFAKKLYEEGMNSKFLEFR